jgi:uncharacterized protein
MSYELEVGYDYDLDVLRKVDLGYILSDGENEVLLHKKEATAALNEGEEVTVFLYQDHEGRLAATMAESYVTRDSYAWLKVVGLRRKLGVFLGIGIQKDLLLSKDDLPEEWSAWPEVGDELYCTLTIDKKGRLFAKHSLEAIEQLSIDATEEMYNTDVNATVYKVAEEGVKVITENRIIGFVHESEMPKKCRLGQKVNGRVVLVKEDGTVNLSLMPRKQDRLEGDAAIIFDYLEHNNGVIPLGDKSSPELIKKTFNMSKAAFKRALGTLMKEGKIEQKEGSTYIKKETAIKE